MTQKQEQAESVAWYRAAITTLQTQFDRAIGLASEIANRLAQAEAQRDELLAVLENMKLHVNGFDYFVSTSHGTKHNLRNSPSYAKLEAAIAKAESRS